MKTRREFIKQSGVFTLGAFCVPGAFNTAKVNRVGLQLYSVRKEMLADAKGTLKALAKIGYKELESARSEKGNYYGLAPAEIRKVAGDLGMKVVSGHVHIDENFQRSIDQAAEAGQQYLICSSLPFEGQTIDNYKKVAEAFNKAGEQCKKVNIIFGYHNHEYEFEEAEGKILYDVLLDSTDPSLVQMELDLGWVVASGKDPMRYFEQYPGRFPLWHLKDMDFEKKESTEFGKGDVNIKQLLDNAGKSGMKHFFVEQEEYASSALESLRHNYSYLMKLK